MTVYELWVHPHLADIVVVRVQFGQVTGVCSLPLPVALGVDLSVLHYDGREGAIARARDMPEQFGRLEPWLQGRWVPVRPSLRLWSYRLIGKRN